MDKKISSNDQKVGKHGQLECVGSIMVSIAAFQAVDLDSIPGRRRFLLIFKTLLFWQIQYNFVIFVHIHTVPTWSNG